MENTKNEKKDAFEQFLSNETSNKNLPQDKQGDFSPDDEYLRNTDLNQYLTVDLNVLPAGIFYKPGTKILIRAATVGEVQAYSSVDDTNFLDVTEKMNEMLSRCVRVKHPNGTVGSYKDLKDNDRLYLIFMIRELTFQKNTNLAKDVKCPECSHEFKIQFRATSGADQNKTFIIHEMSEELKPFFNGNDRVFEFKVKGQVYKLAPPSISIQEAFFKVIKEKVQDNKTPNVAFMKIIPFLLWDRRTITEEGIKQKEKEFSEMDMEVFQFLNAAVDKMLFGIKEMKKECPSCGLEVRTDMTFPKGASSVFVVPDIFAKFAKK